MFQKPRICIYQENPQFPDKLIWHTSHGRRFTLTTETALSSFFNRVLYTNKIKPFPEESRAFRDAMREIVFLLNGREIGMIQISSKPKSFIYPSYTTFYITFVNPTTKIQVSICNMDNSMYARSRHFIPLTIIKSPFEAYLSHKLYS